LDVTLARFSGGAALDDATLDWLRQYRGRIEAARGWVRSLGWREAVAARQETIFEESLRLLDAVAGARSCRDEARVAYARRMAPLVLANSAEAAAAEIDALHAQVLAWKRSMTPEAWSRLTVEIMGRQLPRKDNLAVQYFAKLL